MKVLRDDVLALELTTGQPVTKGTGVNMRHAMHFNHNEANVRDVCKSVIWEYLSSDHT
jgi:hypothetical protein